MMKASAAIISLPIITALGSVVSLPAGLILGLGAAMAVAVLSTRKKSPEVLDAVEAILRGDTFEPENFDRETLERLVALRAEIENLRNYGATQCQDTGRTDLEGLKDSLAESERLLSRLRELLDFEVDYSGELENVIGTEHSKIVELGDYIQTLTAGIEEMNTQAQALTDYALETAQMAETGKRISDNVALNVAKINEVNQDMERAVSNLVERSKRIGEIVEVIGGIAEQTNLLALNAAIEAARSGEHGRGFAVVAENIRELADQSKKSTDQITELIRDMQDSIDTVVNSIRQEFKVTEEIKDAVQELIAAFDDIARRANDTASMIKELSDSIEGQAQSVQMLMDTLDGVYSIQNEISDVVQSVVDSLSDINSRLEDIRKGLKELESSIVHSRELLDNVWR